MISSLKLSKNTYFDIKVPIKSFIEYPFEWKS